MINPEVLLERLNVELDADEEIEILREIISDLEERISDLDSRTDELESLKDTQEQLIDFLTWIDSVGLDEIRDESLRLLRWLR